ncbi:MAG TPA: extracellular solute-binding protein [Clostridiales bacterium]|nr:extracellular solute-binding protein [Clostridiales bacterium]
MKKVVALLMTCLITISLMAGCSNSGDKSASKQPGGSKESADVTDTATEETITLKFLSKYPEDNYLPYFQEAIANYMSEHPNVIIEMESVSDQDIKEKLSVMAAGDTMPDIFFSWSGEYVKKFARSGLALDLTNYLNEDTKWKEGFLPAFLNNSTFDDHTYGIPYRSSVIFMLYNKAIFADLGLEIPKTYDEFLDVCETLKSAKITPISFGNSQTWYSAWWIGQFNAMMVDADTITKDYNPETGEFADKGYSDAVQRFLDLNSSGYFGNNVNSKDYYQVREEFCAGLSGMMLDATAQFSVYEEGMGDDFGFFKFPVMENEAGDPGTITGGAEVYCIASKCEYPKEAVDFVKYMTSLEQAIKQTKTVGLPNCIIGGITADNASANLVQAYKMAEDYTNIADWLDTAVDSNVANRYMQSVQEGFAGEKSVDEIMQDIRDAAEVVKDIYK